MRNIGVARALFLTLVAGASVFAQPPGTPPDGAAPAATSAAYKAESGANRPADLTLDLRDPHRSHDLPIRVYFPSVTEPTRAPVVVFSHGAGGDRDAFPELSRHWASYGYVVIHPTHSDSIKLRRQRGEPMDDLATELRNITRNVDLLGRRDDVRLVLEQFDAITAHIQRESRVSLTLDASRLAMAGHSAGAYTTQVLAGVKFTRLAQRRAGGAEPLGDPRFRAFIVISGQGTTSRGLDKNSWSDIARPMFVIAGSRDVSAVSPETPESRRHPYELAPPGDKYLLFIDGATHGSYAGKRVVRVLGEQPPENIDYITDVVAFGTLAFLDAYLRNDATARAYLGSDALTRYPGGKLEFLRK